MQNDLTEIAFVLDRSGSMTDSAAAAMAGFNEFLAAHQAASGRARLTLVLFDDEYLVPAASLPVAEVVPLNEQSYVPRNSTALLDAIGRTIDELGERLDQRPESERPGTVIVAILTDGLENASRRYGWQAVAARIREQREKYAWQFLFLGANQDAIETAARMQIRVRDAATIRAGDFDSAGRAITRTSTAWRRMKHGEATGSDFLDAAKSLQELADEESKKKQQPKPTMPD